MTPWWAAAPARPVASDRVERMTVQDFDPADRFVAGTVGPAGQRAFYLQASAGTAGRDHRRREAAGLDPRRPHQRRARPARTPPRRPSPASPVACPRTPTRCRRRSTRTGACRPCRLAWDEDAQQVVIECHDHDPDEVDEVADEPRRGGTAGAQLAPRHADAGAGPGLRAAQQRARRRRSAPVPVLRQPARPHGPHLPAGQWLQALTGDRPSPVDLTGEIEVLGRITDSSNLAVVARVLDAARRARHLQAGARRAAALGLPRRHPCRPRGGGPRGLRARRLGRRAADRDARRPARARVGAAVDR